MSEYKNYFLELGLSEKEVSERVENTFNEIFYGENRFFFLDPNDETMGYLTDTGNNDARTEGMSYGMMMCVQLDKKKEFDCLWKWAKKYMYMETGRNAGYFAWSVALDGTKNSDGPAPDGEEYFAMALLFASHRWGDGEGIFNYSKEARELLSTCVHKTESGNGKSMWHEENHLIRFVPDLEFTDPSYHLPHFYELFSKWSNDEDAGFWKEAAKASRDYLKKACDSVTGLSPEYSTYKGEPYTGMIEIFGRHDWYYSDAYRTIANIALDYQWFSKETEHGEWCKKTASNVQKFFKETVKDNDRAVYTIEGDVLEEKALHPIAITATNAQACLATDMNSSDESEAKNHLSCLKDFWETPLRTGERRYYDNCLYMFAMLALSGNYRIY